MAIKIPVVSDVTGAVRGVKDLGDEFDKVADSLDDLVGEAKDAENALDWGTPDSLEKVEDGVKDAADSMERLEDKADDAGDKLERKFRDAADAVSKVKKEAKELDGEKIDIDVDIDKERSRAALNSFKEDVADSGNESGQELAGSMMDGFNGENIVEALTEVVAEATENMSGPMQAAGIGLAIVLALAYAEMAKVAEAVNEAKTAGGEWATSFNTADLSGRLEALREKFQAFATEIADESEWYEFGEAAETAFEQIQDGAAEGGVSVRDFMRAFNEEDPTRRLELLSAALETTKGRIDELDAQKATAGPFESWDLANRTRELHESEDALSGLVDEQKIAIETEEAMAGAMGLSVDQFRDYNELSDEAKERVDSLADGQKGLATEVERANAEIEEQNDLTRDAISADLDWRDTLDGLTDQVSENGTSLSRNTAKGRENIRYLIDAANAIDDVYDSVLAETGSQDKAAAARDKASRELREQAVAAGFSEREVDKLIRTINKTPKSKTTKLEANTGPASRDIRDFVNRDPGSVGVGVYANTSQAQRDVASFRYMVQATPLQMILRAA
jgi:hypothetical protein